MRSERFTVSAACTVTIRPKAVTPTVVVAGQAGTRFTVSAACTACGACLATCPEHCIRPAPTGWRASADWRAPLVVSDACTGCGECAEVCPVDACVPRVVGGLVVGARA